ncbi:helix-turn-helix domain-containing protein [Burkholderia gladioli]|uniref:hypothetical protein n=1 Tax=Burkholderia gladioli TaxID=28095 RepID=UPI0034DB119B
MDTSLIDIWRSLSRVQREDLAARCGTTANHLRNVAYRLKRCSPGLAVALERETCGRLRCDVLCPDKVDWSYLRKGKK